MTRISPTHLTAGLAIACLWTAFSFAEEPARPASGPDADVFKVLEQLAQNFNQHDAEALGNQWMPEGVHVSAGNDAKLTGRAAITQAYQQLFQEDPRCEISLRVLGLHHGSSAETTAACVADVRHSNGNVTRSELKAVLVEHDGKWLLSHVTEAEVPLLPTPAAELGALEWFVGDWADGSGGTEVTNSVRWSDERNFLRRKYHQEVEGLTVRDGEQVIGWDAEQQCIRCWIFDRSGAFGEGIWQPDGENRWVIRLAVKLPDGRRGSLTQIVEQEGPDQLHLQTVARELDGEAQPNTSIVTLQRQKDASAPMEESKTTPKK